MLNKVLSIIRLIQVLVEMEILNLERFLINSDPRSQQQEEKHFFSYGNEQNLSKLFLK